MAGTGPKMAMAAAALMLPAMAEAQVRGGSNQMGNGISSGQMPLPRDIRPFGVQADGPRVILEDGRAN